MSTPARPPADPMHALLGEAAAWIPASLDLAETLQGIAEASKQALGADRATCYASDASGAAVSGVHTTETDPRRRAFLMEANGRSHWDLPIWHVLLDNADPLLAVGEVLGDARIPPALARGLGCRAFIGIRLEHPALVRPDGAPIHLGSLFCTFTEPRALSDADRYAARGLAAMAVLAIANAHLVDRAGAAFRRASTAAGEQAALRRVATAVAESASSERVFALVAEESSRVLGGDSGGVLRIEDPEAAVVVGTWASGSRWLHAVGTRLSLRGGSATAQVARSGRPARIDDYRALDAETLALLGPVAFRCGVAAPIRVGAALWGVVTVQSTRHGALPPGSEDRLASFAGLVGMAIANAEARSRMAREAGTDPLTGLANRRALDTALEERIAAAGAGRRPASLLVIDLDDFKVVNDRHGHEHGDAVLRGVARALEETIRPTDVVARLGGEEFVVILPDTGRAGAALVAERVRSAVRAMILAEGASVTASIGVATFPDHGSSAGEILRAADSAMYDAKALGRDRVVVFSQSAASNRAEISRMTQADYEGFLRSVLALAAALDERDPSTHDHSTRVARYAVEIAGRLRLDGDRVEEIRTAGLLHDIGKVGVSDSTLQKAGPLTDDEWREMRRHPEIGARIVAHPRLARVREWILRHHERPDGRGYPGGLRAEAIPLEARILAVADAFEAMTADRPYRAALPLDDARREIEAGRGTQFDSGVVDAFLACLDATAPAGGPAAVAATRGT